MKLSKKYKVKFEYYRVLDNSNHIGGYEPVVYSTVHCVSTFYGLRRLIKRAHDVWMNDTQCAGTGLRMVVDWKLYRELSHKLFPIPASYRMTFLGDRYKVMCKLLGIHVARVYMC